MTDKERLNEIYTIVKNGIRDKVNSLENRVDKLEQRVGRVEVSIARVETKLNHIGKYIEAKPRDKKMHTIKQYIVYALFAVVIGLLAVIAFSGGNVSFGYGELKIEAQGSQGE